MSKTINPLSVNEDNMHASDAIFIHSLWRSGSTYIFSVFRRSATPYWCYQEPLNEIAYYCRDTPNQLLQHNHDVSRALRHPEMEKPYFQELFETWEKWSPLVSKEIFYDEYFDAECSPATANYLGALIRHAKGRPVIQECRSASRQNAIKRSLGGTHIYLWRNPWDQWWSFKINDYFNACCQLALGAKNPPRVISAIKEKIGYREYHHDNISEEFAHFGSRPLSAENSYLVFYTLWCLAMIDGMTAADLMISIDRLSTDGGYRDAIKQQLRVLDIDGIDLSDCNVHSGAFNQYDKAFFSPIEESVYELLISNGYSSHTIDSIQKLRDEHKAPLLNADSIHGDLERARETVLRIETSSANLARHLHNLLADSEAARSARPDMHQDTPQFALLVDLMNRRNSVLSTELAAIKMAQQGLEMQYGKLRTDVSRELLHQEQVTTKLLSTELAAIKADQQAHGIHLGELRKLQHQEQLTTERLSTEFEAVYQALSVEQAALRTDQENLASNCTKLRVELTQKLLDREQRVVEQLITTINTTSKENQTQNRLALELIGKIQEITRHANELQEKANQVTEDHLNGLTKSHLQSEAKIAQLEEDIHALTAREENRIIETTKSIASLQEQNTALAKDQRALHHQYQLLNNLLSNREDEVQKHFEFHRVTDEQLRSAVRALEVDFEWRQRSLLRRLHLKISQVFCTKQNNRE